MSAASDIMPPAAGAATKFAWTEVSCQRAVNGAVFGAGVQDFNFSVGAPQALILNQSYLKFELELLGNGDPVNAVAPKFSEQIALAENCISNAYRDIYFKAGGQVVSSVNQYAAQVGMVAMRTGMSGAWQRSTGVGAWGLEPSFSERCAATSQGSGPIGLSGMDDCREVTYKPVAAKEDYVAATIEMDADGVCTGVPYVDATSKGTFIQKADIGSTLVIDGGKYTIVDAFAVAPNATQVFQVTPKPSDVIARTDDWYLIKREVLRSKEGRNSVQLCWQPPIGAWQYDGLLGAGDYQLQLGPDSNFAQTMVETLNPSAKAGVVGTPGDGTYTINIKDVKLYICTANVSIPDQVQTMYINELTAQSKQMTSSNMQLSFSVPASTNKIYTFLQAGQTGSSPLYPPSKFTTPNGSELNMESFQITFDGQNKPSTRWSTGWKDNDPVADKYKGYLSQMYAQSLIENRSEAQQGGSESFNDWLTRGVLLCWEFSRDADSRSTEIQVNLSFGTAPDGTPFDDKSKLFIVAGYSRAVEITTANGSVVAVRSLNV